MEFEDIKRENEDTLNERLRKLAIVLVNQSIESNNEEKEKERLIKKHGIENVFTTNELKEKFIVISFLAPLVFVKYKNSNNNAIFDEILFFQHQPRLYWREENINKEKFDLTKI